MGGSMSMSTASTVSTALVNESVKVVEDSSNHLDGDAGVLVTGVPDGVDPPVWEVEGEA